MRHQLLRFLFLLSVAINAGVIGAVAWHHYGPAAGPEEAAPPGGGLRQDLRLTGEQAQEFDRLYAELEARVAAGRERMRDRRRALFEVLGAPDADPAALDAVLAEISGIQADIQRAVADYLLAQARLLAPDQRARYVESLVERTRGEEQPARLPLVGPRGAPRRTP